jgi:hypothetical protein
MREAQSLEVRTLVSSSAMKRYDVIKFIPLTDASLLGTLHTQWILGEHLAPKLLKFISTKTLDAGQ